jgi:hypothetical protein
MLHATRGQGARLLSLAVLLVVLGAVVGSAQAAPHRHDASGLYNPQCPLVDLATVERHGAVVPVADAAPLAAVTTLAAVHADGRPRPASTAHVRFRAPPSR